MKTFRATMVMTAAALILAGGAVQAEQLPADGPDEEQVAQAWTYEVQARQLAENHQEYKAAGELYRKAARIWGEAPEAADLWAKAGMMAYYGKDNRAHSDLARAGEIAMEYGRVAFAAKAFLDGAWVAQQRGLNETALDLAKRGDRLAESPLLAHAERQTLKRRIAERAQAQETEGDMVRR